MKPALRRKARILGFRIIFQREKIGLRVQGEELLLKQSDLPDSEIQFAIQLSEQYEKHQSRIDELIRQSLGQSGWKQYRLQTSLNCLLRLGCAELLLHKGQNQKIVINEILEIAKQFCGEGSTKICNGVLDKVWQLIHEKENSAEETPASSLPPVQKPDIGIVESLPQTIAKNK